MDSFPRHFFCLIVMVQPHRQLQTSKFYSARNQIKMTSSMQGKEWTPVLELNVMCKFHDCSLFITGDFCEFERKEALA